MAHLTCLTLLKKVTQISHKIILDLPVTLLHFCTKSSKIQPSDFQVILLTYKQKNKQL